MASSLEQRRRARDTEILIKDAVPKGDDALVVALRTAIERGLKDNLANGLSEAKKPREKKISAICSDYTNFLRSVQEMLEMKGSATQLREWVAEIQSDFTKVGDDLLGILDELEKAKANADAVRNVQQSVLTAKMLTLRMIEARKQIETGDHYGAMKSLESLQTELPRINIQPMIVCLQTWLPIATSRLLDAVRIDSDAVLTQIRHESASIGEALLRKKAQFIIRESQKVQRTRKHRVKITQISSTISTLFLEKCDEYMNFERWAKTNEFDVIVPQNFIDAPSKAALNALAMVTTELSPIYKTIYMHQILGEMPTFYDSFRTQRDIALPVFFEEIEELCSNQGLPSVLPIVIARVTGFFFVESVLRTTGSFALQSAVRSGSRLHDTNNIIDGTVESTAGPSAMLSSLSKTSLNLESYFSHTELLATWEKTIGYLYTLILRNIDSIRTTEQMLQMKEDILLLAEVVMDDSMMLRSSGLFELVRSLWNRFEKLQLAAITESINVILEQCAFQPLFVTTEEYFNQNIRAFNLDILPIISMEAFAAPDFSNYVSPNQRMASTDRHSIVGRSSMSMNRNMRQSLTLDALEDDIFGVSAVDFNEPVFANNDASAQDEEDISSIMDIAETKDSQPGLGPKGGSQSPNTSNSTGATRSPDKFMPQTFAFSEIVPKIYREITLFITKYFLFAAKNPLLGSRGAAVCNGVKDALLQVSLTLKRELEVNGLDTPLSKCCQISIDASTLSHCCDGIWSILEPMLSYFHWMESLDAHLPSAIQAAKQSLISVNIEAQDLIYELLSLKVDELLSSLIFINFTPDAFPNGFNGGGKTISLSENSIPSHEVIDQMIEFLQITFMCLTHLPASARDTAHFTCCTKVSQRILDYLLSNKVAHINMICIYMLHKDCVRLEQFADSCGVMELRQCFAELHDIVRVLASFDLPTIIDDVQMRQRVYPKLNPSKLIVLLEKVVPSPVSYSTLPKIDKSSIKTYTKKLKAQIK